MDTDLRDILTRVAAGDLAPGDAAHLLDLGPDAAAEPPPSAHAPRRRMVLAAEACRLVLVADPLVAEVSIDGPHGVTRDGDTLRVGVGRVAPGAYEFEQRPTSRTRRFASWAGSGATVRMRVNPAMAIELGSTAAALDLRGLRAPLDFRLGAGSVKVTDHVGVVRGYASTGSVSVEALLREGRSRLDCELGSIDVRLLPGSDVRIHGRGELGTVTVGGRTAGAGSGPGVEHVLGAGAGSLELLVRLGSAKVVLP